MPAIMKPALSPFQVKQKMSLSQTYYLAHTARGKLSKEAARADHDLRLLVGHANLLDGLMLDLADAERAQESWFNQTVRDASTKKASEPRVTWADNLPAVDEAESDSESEADEEEEMENVVFSATAAARSTATAIDLDLDDDEEDEEEGDARLQLTRTPSRSSPPELTHGHESESDSEDEEMPPSPPAPRLTFAQPKKESQQLDHEEALYEEGFYLPPRQQAIAAY